MRTGQPHRTLLGHTAPVTCLQFDETHVVTGSLDKSLRVTTNNPPMFGLRLTPPLTRFGIFAAAEYSKLSNMITLLPGCSLTVGRSSPLRGRMRSRYARRIRSCPVLLLNVFQIYNRTTMQHSSLLTNGHTRPVERIRYMDRYLASGGRDATVKIWAL